MENKYIYIKEKLLCVSEYTRMRAQIMITILHYVVKIFILGGLVGGGRVCATIEYA